MKTFEDIPVYKTEILRVDYTNEDIIFTLKWPHEILPNPGEIFESENGVRRQIRDVIITGKNMLKVKI